MNTLTQRIEALSDARAQHILTTFARNQPSYHEAALSPEWIETLSGDSPSAPVSEGDLARAALMLLADDPAHRPIIDAMASHQPAEQLGLVETAAVMGSVLFVLGIHVKVERDKAGKWTVKIEKKPTDTKLLTTLLEKLSGWIPSKK